MCNNSDVILGYVYDDLGAAERAAFEGHLQACAGCREEADALRATRGMLASWTPPEPDFAFRIVRERPAAPARRWFGVTPVWGLAAAAVLVLAAASAIANVEVRYDASGFAVRTGWGRSAGSAAVQNAATVPSEERASLEAKIDALAKRLGEVEALRSSGGVQHAAGAGLDSAALLRRVDEKLAQSEQRQARALQTEIGQVVHDVDRARQMDLKLVDQVVESRLRGAAGQFNSALIRASQQPR